jgi:TonB-dependent starch-binding outer membrane protein SusC
LFNKKLNKNMIKIRRIQNVFNAIMKITIGQALIAFIFAISSFGFESRGQELLEKKITIEADHKDIKSILAEIEKKGGVKFTYRPQIVELKDNLTFSFNNISLSQILDSLLNPDISYEVIGEQIILSSATHKEVNNSVAITVSGRVTSENNEELPGVSVVLKGTTTGTTTDANGRYKISVPDDNTILIFSFIGYIPEEVPLNGRTTLDVSLMPDIQSLSEVVVVGYGEVKKSDLTGSVSSIKSKDIDAYPTNNVMQALGGRAAGVQISQNNGAPGSAISVRVRGTNSVMGSNEPLYVVDGFPYSGNPTLLNNADIQSIEVLKDASATAIYGSRGANGVVIITTKRGKSGKTSVEYDGYFGWQKLRKKLDMMDATEYANFYNEQAVNDGKAPHFTAEEIAGFGKGTDWQDEIFQTAPIQNHTLSINGGTEKTRFSVSGSNFNQEGIIKKSNYVRNSLRANLSTDISSKFTFDLNAILSRVDSDRQNSGGGNRGGSLISATLSGYPTASPRKEDGSYTNLRDVYSWGSNAIINPLYFINEQEDHIRSNKVLTNGAITYKPLKGLSLKILAGLENTDDRVDQYTTKKFLNSVGSATILTSQTSSILNENTISYLRDFGKHSISAVAGFTYQDFRTTTLNASGSGFVSDLQESFDIGAATTQNVPALDQPLSKLSDWSLLSYLARVNYSFNNKYLATVSFRADGSSRYSKDNQWGYFPSASLAYRLSEEEFIKDLSFISDLKLRAGYGATGSTAIDPYQTLNLLQSGKVVFGDALSTSYAPGNRLSGPLKWETTEQFDAGIDIGLLKNRLSFTVDYYVKNTRDLLNNVPLPSSTGYIRTTQNVGKVQNKGIELGLNAVVLEGNFNWTLNGNFAINKNKVVKLYGGNDVLGEAINISVINDNINILREGEAIGTFYGYVEKGYDEQGLIVFEDFNENGVRDIGDKRIIGNPNPDFIYGLSSTMSYKNFDLNVFIQGSQGSDIFNVSAINQTMDYGQALNMPKEVYENHWTPENTNAKYPVIKTLSQPQVSDRSVEDGSYLRFKNIQLGYNIPVAALKLNWLKKAQLYVSGQNLITITNYSWYDPEINSYGGSNSIRQGMDHYSYPTAKSFTMGIRLGL